MKRILRVLTLCLIAIPSLVQAAVSVNFTSSATTTTCGPSLFVTFNGSVTGCSGTPSYTWYFIKTGTTDTATRTGASVGYPFTGTAGDSYNVVVRAICGAETAYAVQPAYIQFHNQPTINFNASVAFDPAVVCPGNVTFTNISTGDTFCSNSSTGNKWTWNLAGPGGIFYSANTTNFSYNLSTPGDYTINLLYLGTNCFCNGIATKVIHVSPLPVACMTRTDVNSGCHAPLNVTFSGGCSTGATSYTWTFPGTSTPTITTTSPSVTATYAVPGTTNNVGLTVRNAAGCTATAAPQSVSVGNLTANLQSSSTIFCENDTVTFHDRTTVGVVPPLSVAMYLYDLSVAPAFDPLGLVENHTGRDELFTLSHHSGNYTLVDIVTNSNGCTDTVTRTITIRPAPHSAVSVSPIPAYMCTVSGSQPLNVTLSASPSAANYTYTWSFFDGSATSVVTGTGTGVGAATVTHSYTTIPGSGFYSPILHIVNNTTGCVFDTVIANAIRISPPNLTIHSILDSGCTPLRDSFYFTMSPVGISYIIDGVSFGDGSPNDPGGTYTGISHVYTTGSTTPYQMIVRWHLPAVYGGCSSADTASVLIGAVVPTRNIWASEDSFIRVPSATPGILNVDSICPNTVLHFINTGCLNCTYSWHFQTAPGIVLPDPTTDTVTVTWPRPSVPPAPPGSLPISDTGYYYTVQTCLNGCCVTDTHRIWVFPPLVPQTPNPLRINTAATGVPSAGIPAGTASHCNKRDSLDFVLSGTFGGYFYVWDYGDGHSDTIRPAAVPTTGGNLYAAHNYAVGWFTSHNYTVTVTVHDTAVLTNTSPRLHDCFNSVSLPVYIGPSDTAWRLKMPNICVFQMDSVVGPSYVDSSSGIPPYPRVRYSNYRWLWGDGSVPMNITDTLASHIYTATGTFNIRPIFTSRFGCNDTSPVHQVRVFGPTGGFSATPINICVGSTVTFTDNNASTGTTIARRSVWYDYDNNPAPSAAVSAGGGPSTPYSFTHAFPEGSWLVALSDTDASPNRCASFDTIRINARVPHAYFTTNDTTGACAGIAIAFHDTNTNVSYNWNFGDGIVTGPSTTLSDPTHIYSANGTYTVSCTVTSTGASGIPVGCSNTFSRVIRLSNVSGIGIANYGELGSSCPPMQFAAGPTTTPTSYLYNIAWHVYVTDTATYNTSVVFASFSHTGLHHVVMYATSPRGCRDSASADYLVGGPSGTVAVSSLGGCTPQQITFSFTDSSHVPSGSRYSWDICPYGIIDTSAASLTLDFVTPGTYCPPSIVITNGGCVNLVDNFTDSIRIFPRPVDTIRHAPRICYGGADTLRVSGADTFAWYGPGGTQICANCSFIVVHPLTTTTYTVVGTNVAGCTDIDTVTVNVDPPLVITITGRDSMCIGEQTTLFATGGSGVFRWVTHPTPVDSSGLSCAVCNPVTVRATSTHTYWAITTNAAGCTDSASHKVTINPLPQLHYTPDPAYICEGTAKHVTMTGAASYIWHPRIGLSCDSCASPNILINDNLIYSVTGTTQFGCRDSITVPVEVYHHNVTGVRSDTIICYGDNARLYAQGGESYIWTPAASLSNNLIYNPLATPTVTTIYTVEITENVCFKDTEHVKVTVIPTPILRVPSTSIIIAGNSVQLYVDTLNSVVLTSWAWSPADSTLTCADCPRPIATPVVTTTYSVSASTIEGCTGYATVTVKLLCQSDQVYIPNTFTPNGDGNNDRFYVSGKGLGLIKRMAIYNRWGELVYEAYNVYPNNPGVGWDGTFRGEVLAPDVYVYVLDVVCSTGEPFVFRGDISLVR